MQGMHSLANFFWLPPSFSNVCRFTMTQEAVSLDGMPLSHPMLIFSPLWSKNGPNIHALLLWQPQEVWEFLAWPSHLSLLFEEQGRYNILSVSVAQWPYALWVWKALSSDVSWRDIPWKATSISENNFLSRALQSLSYYTLKWDLVWGHRISIWLLS